MIVVLALGAIGFTLTFLMLARLGDRVGWLEIEVGKHRDSVSLLRAPEDKR